MVTIVERIEVAKACALRSRVNDCCIDDARHCEVVLNLLLTWLSSAGICPEEFQESERCESSSLTITYCLQLLHGVGAVVIGERFSPGDAWKERVEGDSCLSPETMNEGSPHA